GRETITKKSAAAVVALTAVGMPATRRGEARRAVPAATAPPGRTQVKQLSYGTAWPVRAAAAVVAAAKPAEAPVPAWAPMAAVMAAVAVVAAKAAHSKTAATERRA